MNSANRLRIKIAFTHEKFKNKDQKGNIRKERIILFELRRSSSK